MSAKNEEITDDELFTQMETLGKDLGSVAKSLINFDQTELWELQLEIGLRILID